MLCKWMVCKVDEVRREAFSKAQEGWVRLRGFPGCLMQYGGWDQKHPSDACIVGLWEDQKAYDLFMDSLHDEVTDANEQERTYEHLDVTFLRDVVVIPSAGLSFEEGLRRGGVLRIAECGVLPERVEHFLQVQRDIWNPGMSQVDGMCGGYVLCVQGTENRFFVMTCWESEESHSVYMKEFFSELRGRAQVEGDVETLVGRLIRLEERWLVLD